MFFSSFLGLSQTLPVTSYIKMIDIWMVFTMTIPFLEVVLHTTDDEVEDDDDDRHLDFLHNDHPLPRGGSSHH